MSKDEKREDVEFVVEWQLPRHQKPSDANATSQERSFSQPDTREARVIDPLDPRYNPLRDAVDQDELTSKGAAKPATHVDRFATKAIHEWANSPECKPRAPAKRISRRLASGWTPETAEERAQLWAELDF